MGKQLPIAQQRLGPSFYGMTTSNSGSVHHERELKWAISASDHRRCQTLLQQNWGPAQVLEQTNRFFDSASGILRKNQMSIRLRLENQRLLLTCKRRRASLQALHHQEEQELWLNTALWTQLAEAPNIAVDTLPLPPSVTALLVGESLCNLGGFGNKRLQWHIDGEVLCLDESQFSSRPQGSQGEWEIEIEIAGEQTAEQSAPANDVHPRQSHWQQWFQAQGISLLPQPRSKLQRFLEGA